MATKIASKSGIDTLVLISCNIFINRVTKIVIGRLSIDN
ncbi:hypothetical protein ymoll0001_28960 [Yersinia mollaretii ATCC 43969]|uniref:Uncharacterized protein n=1 Tax=Yersinia mollaretii (strain ATCC 43969 / DSM 18520 / CIP 103324 / CNY 7263 / WAIP 204) TaxID=349967 RepID=A0ABM9YBB9_YERMW|nr:hypothetical protein ymoll0001_28960 [Yersinia mollaretii ATCC 43969]